MAYFLFITYADGSTEELNRRDSRFERLLEAALSRRMPSGIKYIEVES